MIFGKFTPSVVGVAAEYAVERTLLATAPNEWRDLNTSRFVLLHFFGAGGAGCVGGGGGGGLRGGV
jgi:hypothetical protein